MTLEPTPEQQATPPGLNDHELREKITEVLDEFGRECSRAGASSSDPAGTLNRTATDRILSWVALAHPDTNHVHNPGGH